MIILICLATWIILGVTAVKIMRNYVRSVGGKWDGVDTQDRSDTHLAIVAFFFGIIIVPLLLFLRNREERDIELRDKIMKCEDCKYWG